jgi:hypothetical protein
MKDGRAFAKCAQAAARTLGLSAEEVDEILGSGGSIPRQDRLEELAAVADLASTVFHSSPVAREWVRSAVIDGEHPLDLLRHGAASTVIGRLAGLLSGART